MQTLDKGIDETTQREIEGLLTAFGNCADRGAGDELAELFLEDGTLVMGAQHVRGRRAIATFTKERCADPSRKTRHVWSNLRLIAMASAQVQAVFIQQTYEQVGADQPAQVRVSDGIDEFARDAQGHWRFASRRISRVFSVSA